MHADCPQKFLKICLPNICQMSAKCLPRLESKAKQIQARSIESNQQCKESAQLCPWQPRNHRSCSPNNPRLKPSYRLRLESKAKQIQDNAKRVHSLALVNPETISPAACSLTNPSLKPSCRPRNLREQIKRQIQAWSIESNQQCKKRAQFSSCQPRNHRSCNLANPNLKPSRSPRLESKPNTNTSTIHWIQSTMPKECTVELQLVKQTALSFFAAIYVLTDSARCLDATTYSKSLITGCDTLPLRRRYSGLPIKSGSD